MRRTELASGVTMPRGGGARRAIRTPVSPSSSVVTMTRERSCATIVCPKGTTLIPGGFTKQVAHAERSRCMASVGLNSAVQTRSRLFADVSISSRDFGRAHPAIDRQSASKRNVGRIFPRLYWLSRSLTFDVGPRSDRMITPWHNLASWSRTSFGWNDCDDFSTSSTNSWSREPLQ